MVFQPFWQELQAFDSGPHTLSLEQVSPIYDVTALISIPLQRGFQGFATADYRHDHGNGNEAAL